jgi:hypothetical protein
MVCRLAGVPVPQRAAASNKRAAVNEPVAAGRGEAVKRPRTDVVGTKTAPPGTRAILSNKRPAEDQLTSSKGDAIGSGTVDSNYKRPRVEDGLAEPLLTSTTTTNKRAAHLDPATLREDEDGRTKRTKMDKQEGQAGFGLDGAVVATASKVSILQKTEDQGKVNVPTLDQILCSSCLDLHAKHDMLQLSCNGNGNGNGESNKHAYCRECLQRLYETSVTDPSHFPPRCCSKIISLFNCVPFLSQDLIARFVTRREELETANRIYCSNTQCSKWIRPENVGTHVASCKDCSQKTCTTCKRKEHIGLCPEDKDVQKLMTVAREKRWQTCPNCKEMVELNKGCYHITCVSHLHHFVVC